MCSDREGSSLNARIHQGLEHARAGDGIVHHQLDIYGAWIHVTRDRDAMRGMRKTYGFKFGRVESIGLTARAVKNGSLHYAVFIDPDLEDAGLTEVSAHEAAHLAGMLFDDIDSEYNGSSEPFAYLVGWATTWIWQVARGLEDTAS